MLLCANKRSGGGRWLVPTTNKKHKNFIVLFPAFAPTGPSFGRYADFVKEPKSANVFILYHRIYINIILIFCLKMQSFCFFESRLRHFLQSQKKWGVYPKGTLRRGIVPTNNKKLKSLFQKNMLIHLNGNIISIKPL